MEFGTLYLVPTPIGNLDDMTFRAVKVLQSVSVVFAEDTRTSAKIMKHFSINTNMESYHKFNERSRVDRIVSIIENGEDIAIISDAGTPGISDPSNVIVYELRKRNHNVVCLPGATAFVPALVASGLNSDNFSFWGFLPSKKKDMEELLTKLRTHNETLIFYVAVHDVKTTFKKIFSHFSDRNVALCREISKKFETFYTGKITDFLENKIEIINKGEFVLVIEGNTNTEDEDFDLDLEIKKRLNKNIRIKDIVSELILISSLRKKEIYARVLDLKDEGV